MTNTANLLDSQLAKAINIVGQVMASFWMGFNFFCAMEPFVSQGDEKSRAGCYRLITESAQG